MFQAHPLILSLVMFAVSVKTSAEPGMTVEQLNRVCDLATINAFLNSSGPDDLTIEQMINGVRCTTYFSAMEDTSAALGEALIPCQMSTGVTKLQAIAIFHKWAQANPEHWREPAAERFIKVMNEAFCK